MAGFFVLRSYEYWLAVQPSLHFPGWVETARQHLSGTHQLR